MKNNSNKFQGILAGAVLVAASAGFSAAQEVTSSRKVLKTVAVQYPSVLKRRGIGGMVKLRVLVNPNGTVKDAQVMGGNAILSDCAVKAVKQWVFVASEKEETIEISVGFDPNSTGSEEVGRKRRGRFNTEGTEFSQSSQRREKQIPHPQRARVRDDVSGSVA